MFLSLFSFLFLPSSLSDNTCKYQKLSVLPSKPFIYAVCPISKTILFRNVIGCAKPSFLVCRVYEKLSVLPTWKTVLFAFNAMYLCGLTYIKNLPFYLFNSSLLHSFILTFTWLRNHFFPVSEYRLLHFSAKYL